MMQQGESIRGVPIFSIALASVIIVGLCAYGLVFIYSTGYIGEDYPVQETWQRQAVFLGIGAVLCAVVSRCDYRRRAYALIVQGAYLASLLALLLVLLAGQSAGGARRWLAFCGITFQPAEFAKAFTILLCARILTSGKRWYVTIPTVIVVAMIPAGLIMVEPSYGNAFALLVPVFALVLMRYLGRFSLTALLVLLLICAGGAVAGLMWARTENGTAYFDKLASGSSFGLREYHLKRIRNYIDPHGAWNERQSIVTIASGGPYGKGYLQGTMKGLGFLPRTVAPTDFIFAVIGEEMGFYYGCMPVLALYALLFLLCLGWAARSDDDLGMLVCAGGTMMFFLHVAVNIAMVVRLMPVIGLPLPLLSYGGSYALGTFLLLGAMLSVPMHRGKAHGGFLTGVDSVFNLGWLFSLEIKK